MKNNYLFTALFTLIILNVNAQFGTQQIITPDADGAISVYATDIDGDGDLDVISASWDDDTIAWYENMDGLGQFGDIQLISNSTDGASYVFASDLDGDNDMDIIAASFLGNKISWYENLDGEGDFSSEIIISNNTYGAISVIASDLDSDGDLDIISASHNNDKVSWFKNTDGLGTFGSEIIITQNTVGVYSIYASDLDSDGDMDIVSSSYYDNKVAWFENTNNQGDFGEEQILSTNANGAVSVFATDLDSDGDLDVISASRNDNKICWYSNLDGNGNFSSEKIITTDLYNVSSIYTDDINLDGDIDIIATSWSENKVVWYKNKNVNGQLNFTDEKIISTNAQGASSIYSVDLDGDNDNDILTSASLGDKIIWFENLSILSYNDNHLYEFSVFPNPTHGKLNIHSKTNIIQTGIYNQLGQLVLTNKNKLPVKTIDLSSVSQGIYFLKIKDEYGTIGTQKIVKN